MKGGRFKVVRSTKLVRSETGQPGFAQNTKFSLLYILCNCQSFAHSQLLTTPLFVPGFPLSTIQQTVKMASTSRFHASSTKAAIDSENEYAAHNYHPLPVVFAKAQGINVWDPEGRQYMDFLSAYSAVNQGHCHPELVKALTEQASRLTLSSRAFHNDVFPKWAEKVRNVFGYDMVLPMNTGAEATETAVKVARKWAYKVKGVESGKALVFAVAENFHGRTVCTSAQDFNWLRILS